MRHRRVFTHLKDGSTPATEKRVRQLGAPAYLRRVLSSAWHRLQQGPPLRMITE